jgi:chromosome segregation protein
MVRLEKLVMQGFKSFKRKVSIPIHDGFSVFTGPNGAGKTNISDSICFVLGRSSSKSLRAAKAENLIFHGSKSKPASDYAFVSLHFDNKDRMLPLKDDSVSVSRRINKKGVSTYRLNGKVATRQQIVDVLSQAHIHADGHNIIQQGDVTQIVEMDSVGRREIIDEISGIQEYDEKKSKAMKELGKVDIKLQEVGLLLQEKESIMEKLRGEYESAVKFKRLNDDMEKMRAAIVWKSFSRSEEVLADTDKKLKEKETELAKMEKDIKDSENQLTSEEDRLRDLTKDVIKASNQIESSKKLARLQAEIEGKRERIESNKSQIERLQAMIERLQSMEGRSSPAIKAVQDFKGVHGTVSGLVKVPADYAIAVDVAAGARMNDVVVESTATAVSCVKHLKKGRIGRARFLPLDKIQPYPSKPLPRGAIGWLSDLIRYDGKYSQAMQYVFGSTAAVEDIDTAKRIGQKARVRMVTLDGDLVEATGAITGGFYKKRSAMADVSKYVNEKKELEKENDHLEEILIDMNKEMEGLADKERKTKSTTLEKDRINITEKLERLRNQRREAYEKKLKLQQDVGHLSVQKAKIEAQFENFKTQLEGEEGKKVKDMKKELGQWLELAVTTLKQKEREAMQGIQEIGPVNMKAIEDFGSFKDEFQEFKGKVDKIAEEKTSIEETINKIEEKRMTTFMATLNGVNKNFKEVYKDVTGGNAELALDNPRNLDSGLLIKASPPGKKLLTIDSMSGGEKTLTAFSFLFAIQRHRPAPFYILDEADAALDKRNTTRIVNLLKKQSKSAQFIVISHNDSLVRDADRIYGITMDAGESKIMAIELPPNN